MRFRFVGKYTNGATSVRACGVTFVGDAPSDVTDAGAIARLERHPEFVKVTGRPRKASDDAL